MPKIRTKPIKNIESSKYGVFEFTGLVICRSRTGRWVQVDLDQPYEGQHQIRLWGCDYGYVLPLNITEGARIRFRANVRPACQFGNRFMNFRAVMDEGTAENGRPFTKISIYTEV